MQDRDPSRRRDPPVRSFHPSHHTHTRKGSRNSRRSQRAWIKDTPFFVGAPTPVRIFAWLLLIIPAPLFAQDLGFGASTADDDDDDGFGANAAAAGEPEVEEGRVGSLQRFASPHGRAPTSLGAGCVALGARRSDSADLARTSVSLRAGDDRAAGRPPLRWHPAEQRHLSAGAQPVLLHRRPAQRATARRVAWKQLGSFRERRVGRRDPRHTAHAASLRSTTKA